MSTTETAFTFTHAGKPVAPRLGGLVRVLATVWRLMRNRRAAIHLHDLDDRQLDDIGLSRNDVHAAVTSAFFDDPSRHLTRASRDRASRYYRDMRDR